MNMTLQDLEPWWRQRPRREQVLLIICAVALPAMAMERLWTAPLEKKLRQSQVQLDSAQQRATQQSDHSVALQALQQEKALRQQLQEAQGRLGELRQSTGDAALLPETLRAVVGTVSSVRLLELDLSNSGANNASTTASSAAATGTGTAAPVAATEPASTLALHRLPLSLKVSGDWAALQALLVQIERHAQPLQWESMQLDGSAWPAIELTLKAHVLSTQPRWGSS